MGVEVNNFTRELCYENDDIHAFFKDGHSEPKTVSERGPDVVKYSLKSKILERRRNLGLDRIEVDFTPKRSYALTEEEKRKDERRRKSNRDSALRCRQKQKSDYETNKILLGKLKDKNEQLLDKAHEIEDERNKVLVDLRKLLPEKYIHEALRQVKHSAGQITRKLCETGSENFGAAELTCNSQESTTASNENGFTEECAMNFDTNSGEGISFLAAILNDPVDVSSLTETGEMASLDGNIEMTSLSGDIEMTSLGGNVEMDCLNGNVESHHGDEVTLQLL